MAAVLRAVLFDLDGTLVDNMGAHVDAWIEMGRRFGRELTRDYIQREFSGRKNEELFPMVLGRPLGSEELSQLEEEKEARYRELYAPRLQLMSGVDELLERLAARGVLVGIASAAPKKNRDFVLGGLGLATRMGAIVGAEEVSRGKPAPDLFLEAARRLGAEPSATLVFEDAVLGIQAARAAGMSACGVTTAESRDALMRAGAEATVSDFTVLPEHLAARLGVAPSRR